MIATASIPRKTNVAIIREEYVSITGKFEQALILNQLIYWTQRVYDFDQFNIEENKRKDMHGLQEEMEELAHGWIYKTATQLSRELMTGWSDNTTRKHLKALIKAGFIEERQNPKYKWNQTRQYRVNLNAVESALAKMGYSLPGYTVTKAETQTRKHPIANFEIQNGKNEIQASNPAIVPLKETIFKNDVAKKSKPTPKPATPKPKEKARSSFVFKNNDEEQQLISLVLESERTPEVEARIEKAFTDGYNTERIKNAILYTNSKKPDNYLSYLGLSIDNGWKGSLKPTKAQRQRSAEEQAVQKAKQQREAIQKREAAELQQRMQERESLRILNIETDKLMSNVDITALDHFIAEQKLSDFERVRFNQGKRDLVRRRFVQGFAG